MAGKTIISPEATLSFPNLLVARAMTSKSGEVLGQPKFSATLVFIPGAIQKLANVGVAVSLAELQAAALECAREKFADKLETMVKNGKYKSPFRKDGEEKGYPEGSVFINATSLQKPGVVSRFKGPDGFPTALSPEQVKEMCYPGAIVRASLRAFAYDTNGNRGVSFALNNIQVLGDGPRLDSRTNAKDDFEGLEDASDMEEQAPAKASAPAPMPPAKKKELTIEDMM